MPIDAIALFETHKDEYLQFDRVSTKRHPRADIHAFLLLHDILKHARHDKHNTRDIIQAAEHDVIWLDADIEELAAEADEDQIIELARCGVYADEEVGSLAMFT